MEGGEPGRAGGRRRLGRLQHRAPARAAREPVPRHLDDLRPLLRAQDDVREGRRGLRHLPRRVRDARRAVRVADADPDRQGAPLPGRPLRHRLLAADARLDRARGCSPRGWSRPRTWRSCASPTTRTRRWRRSSSAASGGALRRRARPRRPTASSSPRPTPAATSIGVLCIVEALRVGRGEPTACRPCGG